MEMRMEPRLRLTVLQRLIAVVKWLFKPCSWCGEPAFHRTPIHGGKMLCDDCHRQYQSHLQPTHGCDTKGSVSEYRRVRLKYDHIEVCKLIASKNR